MQEKCATRNVCEKNVYLEKFARNAYLEMFARNDYLEMFAREMWNWKCLWEKCVSRNVYVCKKCVSRNVYVCKKCLSSNVCMSNVYPEISL